MIQEFFNKNLEFILIIGALLIVIGLQWIMILSAQEKINELEVDKEGRDKMIITKPCKGENDYPDSL